jgi:hypothetical protein
MPKRRMTPLAAVVGGLVAGLAGTVCLDAVQYLRYRRKGGTQTPLEWEFAPVATWADAPAPGQVARRVIEGFTGNKLDDRLAFPVSTVMHWGYGASSAVGYGIVAGSLPRANPLYGLPFGAGVWLTGYLVLPEAGLYKPLLEYDAQTLVEDLAGHLAYGLGTATTFWIISKL